MSDTTRCQGGVTCRDPTSSERDALVSVVFAARGSARCSSCVPVKPSRVETGLCELAPDLSQGPCPISPAKEQTLQVTSAEAEIGLSQTSTTPQSPACPWPHRRGGASVRDGTCHAALCLFLSFLHVSLSQLSCPFTVDPFTLTLLDS